MSGQLSADIIKNLAGTGAPRATFGIAGQTGGAAVPAGSIGEFIQVTATLPSQSGNQTNVGVINQSLTAGIWLLIVGISMNTNGSGTIAANTMRANFTVNGAGGTTDSFDLVGFYDAMSANTSRTIPAPLMRFINITSTQTVSVRYTANITAGQANVEACLQALRIG